MNKQNYLLIIITYHQIRILSLLLFVGLNPKGSNSGHLFGYIYQLSLVLFEYAKTKTQISAFVFTTWIVQVQSLYFLCPKFLASSHLLWFYRPVCVGLGRKPRRPVFSKRGSCVHEIDLFVCLIVALCPRLTAEVMSVLSATYPHRS